MFRALVNRYVPRGLLPRRYNTEQLIRYCVEQSSGKSIEQWFALGNIAGPQQNEFFEAMDQRYGKALNSGELELMRHAIADVIAELARYVSDRVSASTSEVDKQIRDMLAGGRR